MTALRILTVSSEAGGARNLVEVVEQFRSEVVFTNLCARNAIGAFEESSLPYRRFVSRRALIGARCCSERAWSSARLA